MQPINNVSSEDKSASTGNVEIHWSDQQHLSITFEEALFEEDFCPRPQRISVPKGEDPVARTDSLFNTDWLSSSWSREDKASQDAVGDEESVSSAAYYDMADFSPSNWMKVMHVPTFGFAIVALATAIAHPLLFVAGAATALGTATAASHGYDCIKEPLSRWLGLESETAIKEKASKVSTSAVDTNDESTVESSQESDEHPCDVRPTTPAQHILFSESTLVDDKLPDNWIETQYPNLQFEVVANAKFPGLNVIEFFQVFFANHAPYDFKEFQKKRGDLDINYGKWEHIRDLQRLSIDPRSLQSFPSDIDYHSIQDRTIRFKAKTNALFGPPYATTTKTQRLFIANKRLAILENMTELRDIPFADRFYVMERWIITAAKECGKYTTALRALCEPIFTKHCPFEGQIRTRSRTTITEVSIAWCCMAEEALKLAEKAKQDRLEREKAEDIVNDDREVENMPPSCASKLEESIEIEHRNQSVVVGEGTDFEQALGLTKSESDPCLSRPRARSSLSALRRSVSHFVTPRRRDRDAGLAGEVIGM